MRLREGRSTEEGGEGREEMSRVDAWGGEGVRVGKVANG